MLEVCNLSKAYGQHLVLSSISCVLEPGKLYGLIGPSGGGKSTFLKVIGGVEEPSCGLVNLESRLSSLDAPQDDSANYGITMDGSAGTDSNRWPIGLMFQEGALFDSLTVLDNVAFPLVGGRVPIMTLRRKHRREVTDRVMAVLSEVGLARAALKYPSQLSGGMRRRASLARALVCSPRVMLLDDPTSGLDPVASSIIMDLITSIHRSLGSLTIIASHDLRRLLPVVDEVICLFDGAVRFKGTLSDLRCANDDRVKTFARCRFDLDAV